jgi:hypothetical protein
VIIEIPPNKKIIPHIDNILEIHNAHPILNLLKDYSPLIAGGYPMALLFAPRLKEDTSQITPGYFSDYDIYFETIQNFQDAKQHLTAKLASIDIYYQEFETPNAVSYMLSETSDPLLGNRPTQIQLIKKVTSPPKKTLATFDFINCAVGFSPKTGSFFIHKDCFKYHNLRELEILKPWMLDDTTIISNNIIIQIVRFKKYCARWEYTLGNKAFKKLVEVYEKHPVLFIEKDMRIQQVGGTYDQQVFIATSDQNIWEIIAPLIRIHKYWKDYKDPHNILNTANTENLSIPEAIAPGLTTF